MWGLQMDCAKPKMLEQARRLIPRPVKFGPEHPVHALYFTVRWSQFQLRSQLDAVFLCLNEQLGQACGQSLWVKSPNLVQLKSFPGLNVQVI
jgi:hypothetical protein